MYQTAGYPYRRPPWRRPLIALIVIAVLLLVIAFGGYTLYHKFVTQVLTIPGCSAGTGDNEIPMDFGQAADTATIAGVAARMSLPTQALTIAYATSYQESKWENLSGGDRDSVGIFQQRPSEGWGPAADLEVPSYASMKFFDALVKVPNYTTIPVSVAAQDVQKSAAGSAYEQWAPQGQELAADYTTTPHAVTCWYDPATQSAAAHTLNLHGAATALDEVFGTPGQGGAVSSVTRDKAGTADTVVAKAGAGWTVADWMVANADSYGITSVAYDGYRWKASLTETSWQPDASASGSGIVAS